VAAVEKVPLRKFDLEAVSSKDYRAGTRNFRYLLGAMMGIILAIAGAVAVTTPTLWSNPASWAELVFIAVAFCGFGIFGIFGFGPGASQLELFQGGLRLVYRDGRSKLYRWDDPRKNLTLWRSPETLPNGKPWPISRWDFRTLRPLDNPLTPDAFDAILESAREAGLEIRVAPRYRGKNFNRDEVTIHGRGRS